MPRTNNNEVKLYRSSEHKVIFGVCGGLAEYFSVDPTIIRLIFVFLTIFDGIGLLAYLVLAIVMPAPLTKPNPIQLETKYLHRRTLIGYSIIFIGLALLINNFAPTTFALLNHKLIWPLLIMAIGMTLIFKKTK